jgi:hypothetical protein
MGTNSTQETCDIPTHCQPQLNVSGGKLSTLWFSQIQNSDLPASAISPSHPTYIMISNPIGMGEAFLKSILRGKSIHFEGVPRIPLAEFSGPNFFLGALEAGPQASR